MEEVRREQLKKKMECKWYEGKPVEWLLDEEELSEIEAFIDQVLQAEREKIWKITKLRIDYGRERNIPSEETLADLYNSVELKLQSLTQKTK